MYKYSRELLKNNPKKAHDLAVDFFRASSIYISPSAEISSLELLGSDIFIGDYTKIGSNCTIGRGVSLGKKHQPCHISIGNNVVIGENVKVKGNLTIGNNVSISPSCIILEDIPDNSSVKIINQLQLCENNNINYLPSQRMLFYGVYPKFKNTFVIMGEGFYNPTVIIKSKAQNLNYNISYWDKNKIIVKIKNTTPLSENDSKGAKLILLCRNNKIVVLNNIGLEKTLTSLTT